MNNRRINMHITKSVNSWYCKKTVFSSIFIIYKLKTACNKRYNIIVSNIIVLLFYENTFYVDTYMMYPLKLLIYCLYIILHYYHYCSYMYYNKSSLDDIIFIFLELWLLWKIFYQPNDTCRYRVRISMPHNPLNNNFIYFKY